MLSSGANVFIWDKMLSSEANVIMVSSGANVIIWCYHVMFSSEMITPPFLFFLETSLTPLTYAFLSGSRSFLLNWIFADFLFISFISPRVNYLDRETVQWNE
jgi:hypothetical protein